MKRHRAIGLVTGLLSLAAQAETPVVKLTAGYEYSTGDYGQAEETRQHYYPFSLGWQQNDWTLKASSSYLRSEGPASVQGSADGALINPDAGSQTGDYQGFGDTTLTVLRALHAGDDAGIYLDLGASARLPTASSDSGISHRDPDYSLWLDGYTVMGNWLPMATLGYRWMGDGSGFVTDNIWLLSLGAQYHYSDDCAAGALVDYQQAVNQDNEALQELFGYISCQLDAQWSLSTYMVAGNSDSSVDHALGFQLSWRQPVAAR